MNMSDCQDEVIADFDDRDSMLFEPDTKVKGNA